MKSLGAPGPYGFPAQFFQKHWEMVGKKECDFIINTLNQNCPIENINDTFITLIPKIKSAKKVGDFHPISLCNVIYKAISIFLANRLKTILPDIISPN